MKKLALCLGILGAISLGTDAVAEPMAAKDAPAKADHATCGQMISGMAPIPAKLSEGASSVADMLEAHAALMGKDKDSMAEAKGLRAIAKTHKQIAALMVKASEEMAKASSWRHSQGDHRHVPEDGRRHGSPAQGYEVGLPPAPATLRLAAWRSDPKEAVVISSSPSRRP